MSDDLIRRSDAIKAIFSKPACHGSDGSWYHSDDIRDAVDSIPSADRPQGEWIEHKERTIVRDGNFIDFFPTEYECSNCGLKQSMYFINSKPSNFCPNCGARMKGADDE